MGQFGWSKEELDKIEERKKKQMAIKHYPNHLFLEEKRLRSLDMKARRVLNSGYVSLISGEKGYLSFEVRSIRNKERYYLNRDRYGNWSGLYTFRDKNGKKLDIMQIVNNPDKSAYIKACQMWIQEYKEVDLNAKKS
jgi:hypothetical protein